MSIEVIKRDGSKESLNLDKIHKVCEYACSGISGVSVSELEIRSQLLFFNGIKTSDIQETLIKAAVELITEQTPNYQHVASRLVNYQLRKEVYNNITPPHLYEHVKKVSKEGFYTKEILQWYSEEEFNTMNSIIDHNRDYDLVYVGIEQFRDKYLVKNRVTGKIYETPQMAYMLIAACLFNNYPKETRMGWIREYYDCISKHYISLPTPIMAGVRTKTKQFSSCVLINCGDSLDSIVSTTGAIVKYVANRAGIGVNAGRVRAKGSPVRGGEAYTTGLIPYLKMFQSATHSASQGAIRKGSSTIYVPFWHLEIEDVLVLKNTKGTEETRIRDMDYGIQLNGYLYKRIKESGFITLFCPNDVPDLYEAFFNDQEKFAELYETYERSTKIKKKKVSAMELYAVLCKERFETGRIYIMNVDHMNQHSPYDEKIDPVYQSNLCCVAGNTNVFLSSDEFGGLIDLEIKDVGNFIKKYPDTKILSHNIKTGQNEWKDIEAWSLTNSSAEVIEITDTETGYSLKCTPDHKIFTKNRGYIEAQDLLETDEIVFS